MSINININNKSEKDKLIKVATFRKKIRKTEPHKHDNYFEIIYLSKGKGTHTIDHQQYTLQTPQIFLVRKEQVHHWDIASMPKGFVLILKKAFVEKSLDHELKILFEKVSVFNCLELSNVVTLEQLFDLLIKENNFTITEGLLKALLAKILEVTKPIDSITKIKTNLFHSFKELLNQNNTIKNNVTHYATLLNTTPQNLNAVCRKSAGKSAKEILLDYIISEAKRLLIYTNNTVSERTIGTTLFDVCVARNAKIDWK
jgi:quercetin dioxygenase-like cupin family protein/AraC-like DNA-binding protein